MRPLFPILAVLIAAAPASAHTAAMAHPHAIDGWTIGTALLIIATGALMIFGGSK